VQRLRPLSEEECYLRCYGWLGEDDSVHVLSGRQPEPESTAVLTERIRRAFEARIDARDLDAGEAEAA
jgi:hypothetical protein